MSFKPLRTRAVLGTVLLGVAGIAQAALVGTTSLLSFNTASGGLGAQTLVDFETAPPGSMSLGGSTAVGLSPSVRNQAGLWNPSGTHFLGVDDPGNLDQFSSGDTLTFNFGSALRAFGLYVVTGGDVISGDLGLWVGGTELNNGAQGDALTDGQGSYAYFMGFVAADPGDAFSSVTLKTNGNFFFVFDVDDLRFTSGGRTNDVPEPRTPLLGMLAACAAGYASRRKISRR